MFVSSFFLKVQVGLITDKQFVASVAYAYCRCVNLVAITKAYAMKIAAEHHRYGVGGTISQSCPHHLLVVGVFNTKQMGV